MISVIIPMFNAEATIIKSLDSVKNQNTEEAFEILVVNDGSTDGSVQTVQAYSAANPEMSIKLINQANKGVSAARNAGLRLAEGEFIALLDADDEWLPDKTARQMGILRDPSYKIDFLTSLWNSEKITFPYRVNSAGLVEITLKKLLLKITGQTSTAVFRRKIVDAGIYFDEDQRYSEDANFWMKVSREHSMALLPESLAIAGSGKRSFGAAGLSANLPEMQKGIMKNVSEMYAAKRLSLAEYRFFYLFSKLKYYVRLIRVRL